MRVRCNWCGEEFNESEILYNEESDIERCPFCGDGKHLMDLDDENETHDK